MPIDRFPIARLAAQARETATAYKRLSPKDTAYATVSLALGQQLDALWRHLGRHRLVNWAEHDIALRPGAVQRLTKQAGYR